MPFVLFLIMCYNKDMSKKGVKQTEEHKRKIGMANAIALKGKKQSLEARKKRSETHKRLYDLGLHSPPRFPKGKENPNYKGGKLFKRALEKDNYTCQNCGNNDKDVLMVDHIVPRKIRPDLVSELSNLQVLCANCHIKKTKIDNKAIILLKLSRGEKIPTKHKICAIE